MGISLLKWSWRRLLKEREERGGFKRPKRKGERRRLPPPLFLLVGHASTATKSRRESGICKGRRKLLWGRNKREQGRGEERRGEKAQVEEGEERKGRIFRVQNTNRLDCRDIFPLPPPPQYVELKGRNEKRGRVAAAAIQELFFFLFWLLPAMGECQEKSRGEGKERRREEKSPR